MEIIDAHTHITPDGRWDDTHYDASLNRLLNEIEEAKLDKVVLLPLEPYIHTEFIYAVCKEYPELFIGFASVEPFITKAIEKLEKAIVKYELKGLKLHPRMQRFRPNDERLFKLYKKAEELGIPIMFDCILNRPTLLKDQLPLLYDEVAAIIPNTPIILAHMGGFRFMDALAVANKNKNVYIDTSLTLEYFYKSPFQDQLGFMFERIGYDRVIYGSDFPERTLIGSLNIVKSFFSNYRINDSDLKKVFGGNIERLTGMK
jgi:hypothetical protein